jgi:hypothetical protein
MKVSKSCLPRNALCIIFLWVRLVFFLYIVDVVIFYIFFCILDFKVCCFNTNLYIT